MSSSYSSSVQWCGLLVPVGFIQDLPEFHRHPKKATLLWNQMEFDQELMCKCLFVFLFLKAFVFKVGFWGALDGIWLEMMEFGSERNWESKKDKPSQQGNNKIFWAQIFDPSPIFTCLFGCSHQKHPQLHLWFWQWPLSSLYHSYNH